MKSKIILLALLPLAVMILAGCGQQTGETPPAPTNAAASQITPMPGEPSSPGMSTNNSLTPANPMNTNNPAVTNQ